MHCGEPLQFDEHMRAHELDPIVELEFWIQFPQATEQYQEIIRRNRRRDLQAACDAEVELRRREQKT